MKTETIYLDEKYKIIDKEQAVYVAIRQIDDSGRLVRESFGTAKVKEKKPAGKMEKAGGDQPEKVE